MIRDSNNDNMLTSLPVPGYWYLVPGTVPTLLVATNLHSSDWVALVVISGHGLRKFGGC